MAGQHIGYVRVSSVGQNTARQLDGVELEKVFSDHCSGGTRNRPNLTACMDYLREGDTLHVHSIDRLARDLGDLRAIVSELTDKGVAVQFHKEGLLFTGDKANPMSILLLNMLGAVAEFERSMINERRAEGQAKAKAEGKHIGRKSSLTEEQTADILQRLADGEGPTSIAKDYGLTRQAIYLIAKRNS